MSPVARRLPHVSPRQLHLLRLLMRLLQGVSGPLAARVAFRLFLTPLRRRTDPRDVPDLGSARQHRLRCGDDGTRVLEWGKGERTALIVHGWGSHAARFAALARGLERDGWRVLALDAPGHGEAGGRLSSLPQFIAALDATLATLGPVHALIGHSLGALAVAMRLSDATREPPPALRKLALISMPSGASYLIDSFETMLGLNEDTRRHTRELFRQRFGRDPEHYTALPAAGHIGLPVLVIHDRDDDVVPFAHGEALASHLPQAILHATEGTGHSGMLRQPQTIQLIAGFLRD